MLYLEVLMALFCKDIRNAHDKCSYYAFRILLFMQCVILLFVIKVQIIVS